MMSLCLYSNVWLRLIIIGPQVIGASLSEPHLGLYSGCGLCHIIRALQRLRSLSHNNDNNNGGISYVLPNAHARSLRGQHFQVQRSVETESAGQRRGQAESHRGSARGIVALLNRIEHSMLYTHSRSASYRIDGYSQLRQRHQQNYEHLSTTQIGFLDSRGQGDLLPACEPLAATVNGL